MSSVMPFTLNAGELCVATINEKPWTRSREVFRALEYGKTTKAADIVKNLCSRENYAQKYQLTELVSETNFMDWPRGSRKDDYYVNEEMMYELLFSSQQPKAKAFRKHCCNVMFPQIRHQLSDKLHAMEIEDLTNHVEALEFTNEEERQAHQHQILRVSEEINNLIANRHVARR